MVSQFSASVDPRPCPPKPPPAETLLLPVNPLVVSVLGENAYASLSELPVKPDIVNVFRLPKFIPAIVDEMLRLGFENIWVQQGIIHLEAAALAEQGGMRVVMDRCIMLEHGYAGLS